ncbi:MAG: DUF2273 domain-containing protein [Tepidibacillus sp.]|uniref:DUF2273 domain-containing protein n=1 Tax=Tepidibacillus sp. HK-1 TaxID=1883407 RepID=UPI0008537CF7|nr:DUF2273 domain-containing protein [Tepidibacillus sp. HK-1]GBF11037.1 hypothetical protein HK1_01055 [Tepidibacillus sp. HK-1]
MFLKLWEDHPGTIVGLISGLFVGFIFLFVGFWKTIIFLGFVGMGLYIGKKIDAREDLHDVLAEILPEKFLK